MKQALHLALALVAAVAPAGDARCAQAPAIATEPLAEAFAWPDGAKAAVSLGYDDALDSQLDKAIPALDRHGLKASFYLTLSSPTVVRRLSEWRSAAVSGHELGNHTLFHQCSAAAPGRAWVTPANDLDTTSVERMAAQVSAGNAMLHAIDGRAARTFTVPCGESLAAGGDYLPAIRAQFVAIKTVGGAVVADMWRLDPMAVPVLAPSDVTGKQLIALVEQAAAQGTMVNLTFHGIGGEHLAVSEDAHDQLLRHLAANRRTFWTDTFVNVMRHVRAEQGRRDPVGR